MIGKLTSTYATLMKEMHKCLPETYTPLVVLLIDVHQLIKEKKGCNYLIDTDGSFVPEVAFGDMKLNVSFAGIA